MKRRTKKLFLAVLLIVLSVLTACLVFAGTGTPSLSIDYCNLSMRDNIVLKYAVGTQNIADRTAVTLRVSRNGEDTILNPVGKQTIGGAEYIIFDYSVAAKEMTDTLYATAEWGSGETKVTSGTHKYSVLKYASDTLGRTGIRSESADYRALMEHLLSYGAAAQTYFGYATDRPADAMYYQIDVVGGTVAEDSSAYALLQSGESVTLTAPATKGDRIFSAWKNKAGFRVATDATVTVEVGEENETYTAEYREKDELEKMRYRYVVMVGLDGAGNFFGADMPNIDSIFGENSSTSRHFPTVDPTISAQAWTSMLHGVNPEFHGITNSIAAEFPYPASSPYPSVFRLLYDRYPTATAASFCGWGAVNVGIIEENIGVYKVNASDDVLIDRMEAYLPEHMPNLLFVHLNQPDVQGHATGYGVGEHLNTLHTVDGYVGRIFDIYKNAGVLDETLFIVTSDHGGTTDGKHGGDSDAEKYVFLGIRGKDLQNTEITDGDTRDIASILCYALNLEMPGTYTSRVPNGVFRGVSATERVEPPLPSDRAHETVGTPTDLSDLIAILGEENIGTYLPFDGNLNAALGTLNGKRGGTLTFTDGYFGKGVNLANGNVSLNGLTLGTDSFSFAFWLKSDSVPDGDPVILANKDWSRGQNQGIALSFTKTNVTLVIGDGTTENRQNCAAPLPAGAHDGWIHIAVSVNRTTGKIAIYADFRQILAATLKDALKANSFDSLTFRLGQDGTGSYTYPLSVTLDEFIFYCGAMTYPMIVALSEYYRSATLPYDPANYPEEGEKSLKDRLDEAFGEGRVDAAWTFDGGKSTPDVGDYTVTEKNTAYTNVRDDTALDASKGSITVDDMKFGAESFTIAFFAKLSYTGGDPVIVGSQNFNTGAGKIGFSLVLRNATTIGINFCDENQRVYNYAMGTLPSDVAETYVHIMLIVNRAANTVRVVINFDTANAKTTSVVALGNNPIDPGEESGLSFCIGSDGTGDYKFKCPGSIDDVIVSKSAFTDADIASLKAFYENEG